MPLPVNWKILLIDDDEDIRDIMTITLEDAGYSVICAPDGHTGLMLTSKEEPQIVITDIKMPGLSGIEVLEKIKKIKPETEVIVTTGFGDIKTAVKALQYDASDFISKPIDDDALHMALKRARQRYVDKKQLSDYTTLLENENLKTSSELVTSVNFQSSLIENSMDGILGCDGNDIIVTYNRSIEKLLGYPKIQVLKKKRVLEFFKPELILKLKRDLAGSDFGGKNRLFLYETSMLSVEKKDIPVQVSGFILSRDGVKNSMVLFIRDLRDLRILKQEMTDQAKLLHREKLISSYLEIIESEIRRCSDLVSGLLKFSRKTKLEQKSIDVAELIRHSLLLCSHKLELSNIALKERCDPDIPHVYGDFNQLEQCVINLIFNAIDAMENGGILKIRVSFNPEENLILISIKDNGKGISKEDLNFIFEPFFTTKNERYGVGLGLSSAYGIIEKHKGTIVVKSILDQGSEFIIKLPPEKHLNKRSC